MKRARQLLMQFARCKATTLKGAPCSFRAGRGLLDDGLCGVHRQRCVGGKCAVSFGDVKREYEKALAESE